MELMCAGEDKLIIRFKGVPLSLKADPGAGSHRGLELGTRKWVGTKVDV